MRDIVIRKDIREYTPKPLFGMTVRQIVSSAAIVVTTSAAYLFLWAFTPISPSLALWIVMVLGGAIGFVGWGRIDHLPPEDWARIRVNEIATPPVLVYRRPEFGCDVRPAPPAASPADRREASAETEIERDYFKPEQEQR